ncbi:MAG: T9SS type A sorting domain-containing protein [Ignavibacteriales bacterium]|nr:T9SS type A sorting domain-containing protein [Ignavibacteriales bacterium]
MKKLPVIVFFVLNILSFAQTPWLYLGPSSGNVYALAVRNNGWILSGFTDMIKLSTNDGTTWTTVKQASADVNCLYYRNGMGQFAGIANGGVLKSSDVNVWNPLGLTGKNVWDIVVDSHGAIYAGCSSGSPDGGGIYKSTGGADWAVSFGTANDIRCLAIDKNDNIVAGATDGVFRSTDAGQNWTRIGLNSSASAIRGVFIDNAGNIFALLGGSLFKTTDNGVHWAEKKNGLDFFSKYPIVSNEYNYIYIGSYGGGVLYSSDAGETWEHLDNSGLNQFVLSLATVGSGAGYLYVGTGMGIYRTARSIPPLPGSTDDNSSRTPTFDLAQNYPNPFNPVTTIKYTLPISGKVLLQVFTVNGQEVATLVNEEKPSGQHQVGFYAGNLPSGIYFYRIISGMNLKTKKLIVLK